MVEQQKTDTVENLEALRLKFGVENVTEDSRINRGPQRPNNQKKPQMPVPPPSAPPSSPAATEETPSLREKILERAKSVSSAEQLCQLFEEAGEIGTTPKVVYLFADMVRRGDNIGVRRFSFSRPPKEASDAWYALNWKQREEKLDEWAKGGDLGAKEVMETLDLIGQNIILRDMLREVVDRFERPCRGINKYGELVPYLKNLADCSPKLAQRITNLRPRQIPKQGVVIQRGRENIDLYLPIQDVSLSALGWLFVKEAEERAKKHAADQEVKIKALRDEATAGLTPLKTSSGEEGFLFLSLGWSRGVLIETNRQNGNQMMARVVKAVNIWVPGGLPSDWIVWSPDRGYVPLRGAKWPLEEIPGALKAWEERILQDKATQAREEEKRLRRKAEFEKILFPVTSIATFPIPFEEQGLTRLLEGECGVVAMYNWGFEWNDEKGLVAIAVERESDGSLTLRKFISFYPLPDCLRGKKLPRLVMTRQNGGLRLEYSKRFSGMKPEIFKALMMVLKILQMRLNAEYRAASGEPAPKEVNDKTG